MNYCCAGEYELRPTDLATGSMAASPLGSVLARWHAVEIVDGKPAARAVDGFDYTGAHARLIIGQDWERQHLKRCLDCAEMLGAELTGYES